VEYMKRNGFVFVETIIAIAILSSSLLLLYSTFSKLLQTEKTRVYYDDIGYVYRTWYIKNKLDELNISTVLKDITNNENNYFVTIGVEYQGLFNGYEKEKTYLSNMLEDFEVNQMIIIKENKLDDLKTCTLECSLDSSCAHYDNCNNLYTNLSDEMIRYIKSLYIDISCTYVLVIEYNTCSKDNTNCKRYYSWVSV